MQYDTLDTLAFAKKLVQKEDLETVIGIDLDATYSCVEFDKNSVSDFLYIRHSFFSNRYT